MFEGIIVLTVLYGCKAWVPDARKGRKRTQVVEMKCLRLITGIRWFDRVRNKSELR